MKPSSFEYVAPRSLDEAVDSLSRYGGAAKVLAGGQSLVPLMNLRLASPEVLVDINGLDELGRLQAWDGGLSAGALVRQSVLDGADLVRQRLPLLAEASALIGHPAIRHRGTVGGSLAHADPAAELPAAMLALEATFLARGTRGERSVPAEEFFSGYLTTTLEPDELLTEIHVPGVPPRTGNAFVEVARRSGDFAICGAAALVTLNGSGRCDRVRIALCGVGTGPVRARRVEEALVGEVPGGSGLVDAAQRVVDEIDPPSDIHGSAAYRRKLAAVVVRRAVELAAQRAGA
ncbi:MAG TPA: xanthine dehydrogenase family protein subunit M [Chloroflexota bacterium]|nr:xanthine dehydrogenase family protein subunit M [Chloroflexota bacterium]